jgi:competence protein ComFC
MSAKELIRRFVAVHKCGGCGEILDFEYSDGAFCSSCQLSWNAAITVGCKNCFKPALECECMPKVLSRAGALCLRRLFFYSSEDARSPEMSIIYWLKYKKSGRMADFVARELQGAVKAELDVLGVHFSDVLVCAVPRSKRALIKYGFDQSEMVAKRLSTRLGLQFSGAIASRSIGKTQKELGKRERLANAMARIKLSRGADVSGKYVILFDDMVTTGASMAACCELLRQNGAKGVLCFSLASTEKL